MKSLIIELQQIAASLLISAARLETDPTKSEIDALAEAVDSVGKSWCGSAIGYHARIYKKDFLPPGAEEMFDPEWAFISAMHNKTFGPWTRYSVDDVEAEVLTRAGNPDLDAIGRIADDMGEVFDHRKQQILSIIGAILSTEDDRMLSRFADEANALESHFQGSVYAEVKIGKAVSTRDSTAAAQGLQIPPHLKLEAWAFQTRSYVTQTKKLVRTANSAAEYLSKRLTLKGPTMTDRKHRIFIGHGGSDTWKELKDFITERIGLEYDEYDREATAGYTHKERLEQMLGQCDFAFIVMTAEDEHADSTKHARMNVAHEAGLFQGRYGFERAIILLENGCNEFSNIHGLGQIRFPVGDIKAKSEQIRQVLEREGIISSSRSD